MDDDIDDLLNEVESKFCTKETKKKPVKAPGVSVSKIVNQKSSDDLDDILSEIFEDESTNKLGVGGGMTKQKPVPGQRAPTNSSQLTKCFPVFIGGSSSDRGLATAVNERACDRLRCTDCDFQVSSFDNVRWHSSTDYLFLRNNMPDLHRLKPKLNSKKGYRAYACQCKWRSVKDFVNLQKEVDLKWVCGKH